MATELVNHFQLTKGQKPSVEEERKARSGLVRKYLSGEQLDAEEIKSIETDFDFSNLNYRTMWFRMMRKRPSFFVAAMVLQIISIFQVTGFMPSTRANHLWSGDRYLYLSNATETPSLAAFLQDNEVEKCFEPHNITLEHASLQDVFATPLAQGWSYQADFSTTFALDRQLRKSYDRLVKESGFTHMACEEMWLGWEETTNRFVRCPKGMKWNATLWAGAGKGGGD